MRSHFVFQKLLLVITIYGLTACSSSPPEKVTNLGNTKSIVVISAVKDVLSLSYKGLIAFNNTSEVVPVNWGLSTQVLGQATTALMPYYQVKSVNLNRQALDEILESSLDNMPDKLQTFVPPHSANLVVVIGVNNVGNAFLSGQGRINRVGVIYVIGVFDGDTYRLLARGYSGEEGTNGLYVGYTGQPYAEFSDAEKARVHTIAVGTLPNSISAALRRLGLLE